MDPPVLLKRKVAEEKALKPSREQIYLARRHKGVLWDRSSSRFTPSNKVSTGRVFYLFYARFPF